MFIGTGLCLAAAVWFCIHQQVVEQPRIEDLLSQKRHLFEAESAQIKVNTQVPIPLEKAPSVRMHIVLQGQTLSDISKIYYGSNTNWKKIYEANKEMLSRGPDAIKAGMKLAIPQ